MSYPEDSSSPKSPFGEAGDLFNESDIVSSSPTTNERIVDTQSGYLVVVKRVDGSRVALSVKRRLGTPPSSSILLTPDEQVKLGKILAEARTIPRASVSTTAAEPRRPELQKRIRRARNESFSTDEVNNLADDSPEKEFARVFADQVEKSGRRGQRHSIFRARAIILAGTLLLLIVGGFIGLKNSFDHSKPHANAIQAEEAASVAEDARIDHFVRGFVADMLDFDPSTYRSSQIHAMAVMSQHLLDRYWQETNFPLTKAQLDKTPKGRTLIITKVTQESGTEQTKNVDLFAELASSTSKVSTPVHLKLKVGYGMENQLRVLDQKDLSATK